jgi:hypothetical protein
VANLTAADRHWAHAIFDFIAARYGAEGVRGLLFSLRKQNTVADAVPTAFSNTLDQFDREFHGYVTGRMAGGQ